MQKLKLLKQKNSYKKNLKLKSKSRQFLRIRVIAMDGQKERQSVQNLRMLRDTR